MTGCIVLFSGGLDSVIATHLLKAQGLEVTALHFVLPFESGVGLQHSQIRTYADALGVPLRIEEEGEAFMEMIKDPRYGYGKHANPCIDCRIHRLGKAAEIMEQTGAAFLATGEVIGQRPMSQRREALLTIEKQASLAGRLLRPLSAKLLEPTIPEQEGLVDRERLLAIKGRSRKPQLAYAREHGLIHGAPAGGCILTQSATEQRFSDLQRFEPSFGLSDFRLLAYGRHFRLSEHLRLIVGRNQFENGILDRLREPGDTMLQLEAAEGPTGILRGSSLRQEQTVQAASILVRYSKLRTGSDIAVRVEGESGSAILTVSPATDEFCAEKRV